MYNKQQKVYSILGISIKRVFFVSLLLWLLCYQFICSAQVYNTYDHLNSDNLLQSNRIYNCVQDKYGYLWIATEQGVYKYNGYTVQKFGFSEGLPSEDVWDIVEDSVGRMWLGSITNELGYIQKGRYKKVNIKGYNPVIYPQNLQRYRKSIQFKMPYMSKTMNTELCRYEGDTLRLFPAIYKQFDVGITGEHRDRICYTFINESGEVFLLTHREVYKKSADDSTLIRLCNVIDTTFYLQFNKYMVGVKKHSLLFTSMLNKMKMIKVMNLNTSEIDSNSLTQWGINENLEHLYYDKLSQSDSFIVFTKNEILYFKVVDSKLSLLNREPVSKLGLPVNGAEIKHLENSRMWGTLIGTSDKGLFIQPKLMDMFAPTSLKEIEDANYIGNDNHKTYYWWNTTNHTLISIDSNSKIKSKRHYEGKIEMRYVMPYNEDTLLILGEEVGCTFFMDIKTGALNSSLSNYIGWGISGFYKDGNRVFYVNKSLGFGYRDFTKTETIVQIENDRFSGLVYRHKNNELIAYNAFKLCFYNITSGSKYVIDRDLLTKYGIKKIENVIVSDDGDKIYIKDFEKVVLFDKNKGVIGKLFTPFNLIAATLHKAKDGLIVVGKFGVAYQKLNGSHSPEYKLFENYKLKKYKAVYDVQESNTKLILKTDKGIYSISLIDGYGHLQTKCPDFKLLINADDSLHIIASGDTLRVLKEGGLLSVDLINPSGYGTPEYFISYDNGKVWKKIAGSEITLPSNFKPDYYYRIQIKYSDYFWRSEPVDFIIYMCPKWWQTRNMNTIFWTSGILLLIGLIGFAVFLTRRLVLAANLKKNARMEIELKSVYSQINPHFIFNTLNSSLYFIRKGRMEDANDHVMKFSKLLRAYIKSSRDKYIVLSEELENLRNYIVLQQVRFDTKFEYTITLADDIDTKLVKIPSLLLQPLVENAIDHGLFHKDGPGLLELKFYRKGKTIVCVIEDDGIGRRRARELSKQNKSKPESYGEGLVQNLVDIFNKYEKVNITISYFDKPNDGGTIVEVIIGEK